MRWMMGSIAVLAGTLGVMAGAVAMPENNSNNSSLAPLTNSFNQFKAHLDEEMAGQIRSATNGNYALGGERFQKEIEIALGRRARRGYACRPANDINPDGKQGQLKL